MFLEILFFILIGILTGVLTGLIPGLHPNNLFFMLLAFLPFLSFISLPCLLAFVVSLAVSNTFMDFIPTIFFGAPEEGSLLSVLPGHRMLLEGRGYEALFLTVVGGLSVVILTVSTLPALLHFIPVLYQSIRPVLHFILLAVVFWMIITEKGRKRLGALVVFGLAGLFGFLSLNSLPSGQALFPALTGLFAIPTLITSVMLKTRIPEQKAKGEIEADWIKGGFAGWIAGLIAGLLPGLGPSQAGIMSSQFLRAKRREFMITLGGINTSNIFFTFMVFYALGKTRSGAAWFVSQVMDVFSLNEVILVVLVGLMTSFLSVAVTLKVGRLLASRMRNMNYTRMTLLTLVSLACLVLFFSGTVGLLVALSGTFLGLATIKMGVKRSHLMGFLLFPTMLYYAGMSPFLLFLLS